MKYVVTVFLLSLTMIFGCATTKGFKQVCDSWIGESSKDLIRTWGYPDQTMELEDGNVVYVYPKGVSIQMPTYADSYEDIFGHIHTTIRGGGTIDLWCIVYFEVDEQGTIINYSSEGNNCVAREE